MLNCVLNMGIFLEYLVILKNKCALLNTLKQIF